MENKELRIKYLKEKEQVCPLDKDETQELMILETMYYEDKEKEEKIKWGLEFEKELVDILDVYTEYSWNDIPLSKDEADRLTEHLRNQLYLMNNIITREEYEEMEMLN